MPLPLKEPHPRAVDPPYSQSGFLSLLSLAWSASPRTHLICSLHSFSSFHKHHLSRDSCPDHTLNAPLLLPEFSAIYTSALFLSAILYGLFFKSVNCLSPLLEYNAGFPGAGTLLLTTYGLRANTVCGQLCSRHSTTSASS